MFSLQAITSAFRAGRDKQRGELSFLPAIAFAIGALLGWLARRTERTPPVHLTGAIGPQSASTVPPPDEASDANREP
jgi:hypothetical protein